MPYTIHIDPASQTAQIRVSGILTGAEVIAACRDVFTHPDWRGGFSTLWDADGLRALDLLPDDVTAFAVGTGDLSARRGPGRSAIVTSDPSVHINALLLGLKSRARAPRTAGRVKREVRVFSRRAEAEAWLTNATT